MPLTREEVEHIAQLARLELTEDEKARYREQLSAILDYVAKLQELDTSEVPPMSAVFAGDSHPVRAASPPARHLHRTAFDAVQVDGLRPDRARAPLSRKSVLKNAPDVQDDQFKIPPVFE
jgi:aspartyl-tRNA(Asn)/glutamyl-tRNA(Gln) amidotransferase subunit C